MRGVGTNSDPGMLPNSFWGLWPENRDKVVKQSTSGETVIPNIMLELRVGRVMSAEDFNLQSPAVQ